MPHNYVFILFLEIEMTIQPLSIAIKNLYEQAK